MKSGHVKMTGINIYKKTEVYNHSDTLKINNIFIKATKHFDKVQETSIK